MSSLKIPATGLVTGPHWAGLIVNGEKTWELRKRRASIGKEFGIIAKGTGTIVGAATIADCLGPLDLVQLMENRHLACESEQEILDDVKNGYDKAWVLANARAFDPPVRYRHPSGAVTWVTLSPDRLIL